MPITPLNCILIYAVLRLIEFVRTCVALLKRADKDFVKCNESAYEEVRKKILTDFGTRLRLHATTLYSDVILLSRIALDAGKLVFPCSVSKIEGVISQVTQVMVYIV